MNCVCWVKRIGIFRWNWIVVSLSVVARPHRLLLLRLLIIVDRISSEYRLKWLVNVGRFLWKIEIYSVLRIGGTRVSKWMRFVVEILSLLSAARCVVCQITPKSSTVYTSLASFNRFSRRVWQMWKTRSVVFWCLRWHVVDIFVWIQIIW